MAASAMVSEKIKGRDPFGFADSKIEEMMKKQGWNRGEGLGSSQVGDASFAIKVKRKNTKSGLGDDPGKEFKNDWWHKIFDNAAKNIGNIEPEASTDIKESLANEMKKPLAFRAAKLMKGAMFVPVAFVKRETLTTGDFTALNEKEEEKEKQKKAEEKKKKEQQQADSGVVGPSYDELFAACDGLMVHKGARHGLNYKGKLERLREQEAKMLRRMRGEDVEDEKEEKKTVKLEKLVVPIAAENEEEAVKKIKKSKKKKKKLQAGLDEKTAQVEAVHKEKTKKKKKKNSEKAPEEVAVVALVNDDKTTKKKRKKSKKTVKNAVDVTPEACAVVEGSEKSKKSKKRKLKDQSEDGDNAVDTQTTAADVAEEQPKKKKKKKSVEAEKTELAAERQKKKKSKKSQK